MITILEFTKMPPGGGVCMVCKVACVPSGDYFEIFGKEPATETDLFLASLVSKLLDKVVTPDPANHQLICRKCFFLITELEELQTRVAEIQSEIFDQQEVTLIKQEIDENQNEALNMLLITSEEDSNQVTSERTFEGINLEMVKMQDVDIDEIEQLENTEMETNEDTNCSGDEYEIVELPAENSSSLNYTLSTSIIDNNDIEAPTVKKEIHTNLDIKKPNILRKKLATMSLEKLQTEDDKESETSLAVPVISREDNMYTCLLCEEETIAGDSRTILAHFKIIHKVRLYICDICGQDFCKRNHLSAHLEEHMAAEDGDFQCEICNRIFNNLRLFRIHKRMHNPQVKSWTCDSCGKRYSSKNLLDEHSNIHLGVRPYVCKICKKCFTSKYTYRAHEKTHEVRPRPFKCSQCDKSFLSQQNLTQHERTHSDMKEFSCQLCGKLFGSAHNLEVHSIVHTGYKPFVCGLCGKAFARKNEIRDHERIHTGERPYQCELCGATFSQRSNLQSHKRATHFDDKRYQCSICGKGFKRRRLLDYHVKAAHTGERPYKCETCSATFIYPEHFKKHQRIHTGEKPFLCEVCGKAFNSRDNRNAHRYVHSDKKPYECLVCGTGFMRKPLLYQHMQLQGHLNDTIVINQPRLTTDDDHVVTVNDQGDMEIVNASIPERKLYIQEQGETEHIIIDGGQITFASDEEKTDEDYEAVISSDALANGETQIIETPDGPVQLVKVLLPNENGQEEEAWIKIVS